MASTLLEQAGNSEAFAAKWVATLSSEPRPARHHLSVSEDHRFVVRKVEEDGPSPATFIGAGKSVVFEGFLYDVTDLRANLGLGNLKLSDAELVVRAYERWGEDVAAHLKGIFAFCLWDSSEERLVAARDRLGIYPLYYARQGGEFFLSSSVESFAHGPGLEVDRAVIAGLLARQHPELHETFHRNVRRVPPGHRLASVRNGSLRVDRYWDIPIVGDGAEWVEEDELHRFGELLDQAVGRALDRGPAAIFLSGGLDSVSVAASAAERTARTNGVAPLALSLLFPGEVGEGDTQRGVASRLGMQQRYLEFDEAVGPEGLIAAALQRSAINPAPLQNVWQPAYLRLAQEGRAEGRRVVLSGGGGDEWLTVSPVVAADMIRSLDLAGLMHFVATQQRSLRLPRLALLRNIVWTNGVKKLGSSEKERLIRRYLPELHRERLERGLEAKLMRLPSWATPDPGIRRVLERRTEGRYWQRAAEQPGPGAGGYYFSDRNSSLDHPLLAIDAEEIFFSGRESGMMQFDTYWDADLVEFLSRVPPRLLNQGGRNKGLVRGEVARRLPGFGFERQRKLVSRDFFCSLFFSQAQSAWRSLGGTPALAQLGLVERSQLDEFVRGVLANRDERHVDDLWRIMSLESWVRPRV